MTRTLERIDEVILGRVTYEMWAPYWSTFSSDGPDQAYADFINSATKHVVSRTLAPEDLTLVVHPAIAGASGGGPSRARPRPVCASSA
ncbi:hypothetical protein [Schaalia hyovaginalis]|uniref:hypothetical protein n=1 Tax=Schaalia hyovaginalis TaxID=29316 RepID=UPI002A74ED7F|nr:hypothetical protein [Schaalia hyovaginalis]MDY2669728.1 hypothetical protein [Schaalia hyovaginalis]